MAEAGEPRGMDNSVNGATFLVGELNRLIGKADNDQDRITLTVLKLIYTELRSIKTNPMLVAGEFMRRYPKTSITIFFILMILMNMWFVSGWRQPILLLLGIPPELVP